MASAYFMILTMCGLFYLIHGFKRREGYRCTEIWCFFWYAITRAGVLLAVTERNGAGWSLLADIAVTVLLVIFCYNRTGQKHDYDLVMFYIFWPGGLTALASGSSFRILYVSAILLVFAGIVWWKRRQGFRLEDFFGEYVVIAAAYWLLSYAYDICGQRAEHIWRKQDNVPMILLLGGFLMVAVFGNMLARKKILLSDADAQQKEKTAFIEEKEETENPAYGKAVAFRGRDMFFMTAGTLLFFVLALFRLGTFSIPSSEMHMTEGKSSEMIFDFGSRRTIERVEIFLGYEAKKTVSFSVSEHGQWKVIKSKQELDRVFRWNEVKIDNTQRYLGCKFLDSETYVREMVFLDEKGRQVLPVNVSDYPELFDEQECYPGEKTYYYQTMFDEVYHARTAYEFLHTLPIYENTHPPLGKIILSIGIALFGMNPFGWRFMSVLCGALILPFIYLFGLRLTGKTKFAVFSMVLVMTGFMHFSLSRIATLDSIAAFCICAVFYFMFAFFQTEKKRYLVADGVTAGIAMAVKWTGVYAVAGVGLLFLMWCIQKFVSQKHGKVYVTYWFRLGAVCVLSFLVIPAVIYVLSYIPFARVYTDKNILEHAIANSKLMFSYHKDTVFEHPYSSEWYEWIFSRKSLLDAISTNEDGWVSSIATVAGPVVCWGGIPALLYQIYLWALKKDLCAKYLVMAYAAELVPWMFIHRTVFIYHYMPCLNILALMIPYSVYRMKLKRENRWIVGISILAVVLFVLFYPELSGLHVPREYVDGVLEWLPGWRFV